MTRTEIRDFLQAGVNALTPVPEFGSGLVTDFNSIRSHEYPAVWQIPAKVTVELGLSAPLDSWEIDLIVAQKDRMDSSPVEYQAIIDECDTMAQKLIYKYRNIVEGYKNITMVGIEREDFFKKYADCLSGVNLKFTLVVQNKTDVC